MFRGLKAGRARQGTPLRKAYFAPGATPALPAFNPRNTQQFPKAGGHGGLNEGFMGGGGGGIEQAPAILLIVIPMIRDLQKIAKINSLYKKHVVPNHNN